MLQYKTPRIEQEYGELYRHNPSLFFLVKLAADYIDLAFFKNTVLTCVYRSPEENASLYAATGKEPEWRPHTKWMGVDIRTSHLTQEEINKVLAVLQSLTVFGGQRKAAVYHAIKGNVPHFHIQCAPHDLIKTS